MHVVHLHSLILTQLTNEAVPQIVFHTVYLFYLLPILWFIMQWELEMKHYILATKMSA